MAAGHEREKNEGRDFFFSACPTDPESVGRPRSVNTSRAAFTVRLAGI